MLCQRSSSLLAQRPAGSCTNPAAAFSPRGARRATPLRQPTRVAIIPDSPSSQSEPQVSEVVLVYPHRKVQAHVSSEVAV